MTVPQLARLKRVDLRDVWKSEPGDFTPWLALPENIALLGETIAMDLEVEAQEKDVGPFRADILCRETVSEDWVLIENQLNRTDHTHLGQLMTYAAGLRAVTIVWIAQRFTDEHRAALDWLNGITDERFRFFGLEVEAWRIGDSLPAPKFNVVSSPNEWSKEIGSISPSTDLTPAKAMRLDFWQGFVSYARENAKRVIPRKPSSRQWMNMAIGRTGFHLSAIVSTWNSVSESYDAQELRAELQFRHDWASAAYEALRSQREEIESAMGQPLHWVETPDVQKRRIFLRRNVDLEDRSEWPEYFQWLCQALDRLHEVMQPRILSLDFGTNEDAE